MEYRERDGYEEQKRLLDKFIVNGDTVALKKIFNKPFNNKQKKQTKFVFSQTTNKFPSIPLNYTVTTKFKKLPRIKMYNFDDPMSFDENRCDTNNIYNYKIDLHNIIQDPEYKDKSMKGNYKWGIMKFNLMKTNWAKRRGVSLDNFEMPKLESYKKKKMIQINGENITNSNKTNYNNFQGYLMRTNSNNFSYKKKLSMPMMNSQGLQNIKIQNDFISTKYKV